ncbi:hypothetical protein [Sphingomonas xinjiangensis]|uniref:Uncharacterized protein n=1 Tax=Sphingomonas xinjiangensis TaxID=643568 RepID=A0A840YNC2_9SPHN|nr:hypothetical protein [Sphingomonas xinjiangensis]MBB5709291.1 hypothetical protein [Sphingomonas xinjiangensis]
MSDTGAMGEREPIERVMLAAWLGVEPHQLPENMRAHTCADTMERWKKVGEAAVEFARLAHSDETAGMEIGEPVSEFIARETEKLVEALREIAEAHLGDQPAASGGSEYDWAVRHIARIRGIARTALASGASSNVG